MNIFIAYSNRSCITGKALRQALRAKRKKTNRRAKCKLLVRFGNTEEYSNLRAERELNSLDATKQTSNKLRMITTLASAGIPVPKYSNTIGIADCPPDRSGNYYIRSNLGVVRYGNDFGVNDSYVTSPIPYKRREYRVHVFCGKVIGIYEKIPNIDGAENRPKLFKSDTCKFVRCDLALSRVDQAAQEICIASVQALGLDFGGVDLIRNKNGEFFVCEVNSSPGLNSQMIEKYKREINELLGA